MTITHRPWYEGAENRAPARPHAVLQKRGVERMHAILDAAEEIMLEGGYEAATLKAVSQRTGIPTASVYHYFLDRHQIDKALILRHIDALDDAVAASLAAVTTETTTPGLVSAVLDPMVTYFRANPSCIELWFGQRTTGHDEIVRLFDEAKAEEALQLAIELGHLRADTPMLAVTIAFEVGTHLFDVAFRRAPGYGDDETFDQARLIISLYLKAFAPERSSHV